MADIVASVKWEFESDGCAYIDWYHNWSAKLHFKGERLEWIQQWRRAEQSGYIDIEDVKRQRLLESNTEADRIVQTKRQVTTLWKRLICNANQTELRFYAGNWEQKDEKNEGKYLLERLMQTEACQIKDLISTLNHTYRMARFDKDTKKPASGTGTKNKLEQFGD
jgi:hypothetical protein